MNEEDQKDIPDQPKLSDYTGRILLLGVGLVILGIILLLLVKGIMGVIILVLGAVFGLGSQVAKINRL